MLNDFERLVKRMRDMQKQYFRTRDANTLRESKSLEREVDKVLEEKSREDDCQLDFLQEMK